MSIPRQFFIPPEIKFDDVKTKIIDDEIADLLRKGAISNSSFEDGQFCSNIFVVNKPGNKFRPIINLKKLNEFIIYEHFKQEHFKIVLDLVQRNDYFCSIDLKDAYYSIPIHEKYRKFLKFYWRGILYEFNCMPFGYSAAPKVFTKLLKPVYAWFRSEGIRCSYYIDDSINMNPCKIECGHHAKSIANTLISLGYTINEAKSVFKPTQIIEFFGFILDSVQFKVFLTSEKINKIKVKANFLLDSRIVVVRDLASFIGLIISSFYALLEGPLHYRCLEKCKLSGLGEENNYDNTVILDRVSANELQWWIDNVEVKNGKSIRPRIVDISCQSDASLSGWSCFDLNSQQYVNGRWSYLESKRHINHLELLAIWFGLNCFYSNRKDCHIHFYSDSVTAVTYINNMGGMTSNILNKLSQDIWEWCLNRNIYLSASFLKGSDNVIADFHSRNFSSSCEWMLKKDVFRRIVSEFFMPEIDLFASRINFQCKKFVSLHPSPGCWSADAFSFSWNGLEPYLFPPFCLIGKVLNKLFEDKVNRAILIMPLWRTQFWFPLVMNLLISIPVRLPNHKDLLTLAHNGKPHPFGKRLQMVGVQLSGDVLKNKVFLKELSKLSLTRGKRVLSSNIHQHGKSGFFGQKGQVTIPLKQLKLR